MELTAQDTAFLKPFTERVKTEKVLIKENRSYDSIPMHDHSFLELTYILSGEVVHDLDGTKTLLHEGDYLIVDYGSRHSYQTEEGKTYDNIDCLFLPELLDPVLKGTKSLRTVLEHYLLHFNPQVLVQNPARMVFHDNGRVLDILNRMMDESRRKEPGYLEFMRCYLIEILLLTMRHLDDSGLAANGQDISAFLVAYVAEHYMEDFTLKELADRLFYSLPYISKKFKDDVGVSFVHYLQNYRVMQGCRLLSGTKKTLSEIAELVGYRDVKFFSALVKKMTGIAPGDFRREHRRG